MADNAYAPSPLTAPADATTYAPSRMPSQYGPQIPPGVTVTPAQISKGIISNESGGRNVVSPQGARGPGQIMPATFRQYARPGESIDNPADNLAVHNRIIADYAARWPNDPARVAVAYFSGPGNVAPPGSPTPWKRNVGDVNESVAKYVANATAKMGGPADGTAVAATPAVTPAQPATPANVGMALAALNTPTGGPGTKSTMDNLQSMAGGGGGGESAPAPLDLQTQQAASAMGNARQAQIAALAPQLMAASRARGGLQGVSGPASSLNAQGIPMPIAAPTPGAPGTTLNSTGGLYG